MDQVDQSVRNRPKCYAYMVQKKYSNNKCYTLTFEY